MSYQKSKAPKNNDDQTLDMVIKAGGWLLSGAVAIAAGVAQGIGDVLDSTTDL